jgi:hypothetical protein
MKNATNALRKAEQKNPLRRVSIDCHGWVRDALAATGEWVWCESCSDWRRVATVVE